MTFIGLLLLCFIGTAIIGGVIECVDWKRVVRDIINKIEQSQHKR